MRARRVASAAAAAGVAAMVAGTGSARAVTLEQIGTYSSPIYVTSDPTDPDRIFVVEREGRIRLTTGGQTTTVVDLDPVVLSEGEPGGRLEHGLLSMAFAPDYPTTGRFYVFYTGVDGGAPYVGELTARGDTADPATLRTVIKIEHPGRDHYGGQLQFGRDGYLYVSTGDGLAPGDPEENAQDTDTLLGKILRIDPIPGGGYTIPPGNPFVAAAGADEVWSYGLRNPWRFSFDRATGDLAIGDVGQELWEEIDFDPMDSGAGRGKNFGWDCREGRHDFEVAGCAGLMFTEPIAEYQHPPAGAGCAAVTGGYVVRDPGLTELQGRYVYTDHCGEIIRSLLPAVPAAVDDRSEGIVVARPSSFGEDVCGRVYVASLDGPVYRLVDSTATECSASPQPIEPPPPSDSAAPGVALSGKERQGIGDRRVSVNVAVDEAAMLEVGGEVVGYGNRELFDLSLMSEALAGAGTERVSWKLKRRQAARARRRIRDGQAVKARLEATATDSSGNRAPSTELTIRLVT